MGLPSQFLPSSEGKVKVKMKMNMFLMAVASAMSSVLSTQGKRVTYVHISNYAASDPCFRSASAW